MNDPTHPIAASPLHEEDAYGWAVAQAELIRARNFDQLDWEQLAEEIEAMARSEYRALESALRVLILHLLKWDAQAGFRSMSWIHSVEEHASRYRRLLDENPSLRRRLDQIRVDAHASARRLAAAETGLPIGTFPIEPLGWNVINNPPVREEDLPAR